MKIELNRVGAAVAMAALMSLATTGAASAADLLSGIVTITNNSPDISTVVGLNSGPTTGIVDVNGFNFSFTGNTITYVDGYDGLYTSVGPSLPAFNGFVLTFSGVPTISGVTLDPSSQQTPTLWSNTNQVFVEFNGGSQVAGATSIFDVSFASGVPEAASWEMMLVGLGGLGWAMRSRRKPAAVAG